MKIKFTAKVINDERAIGDWPKTEAEVTFKVSDDVRQDFYKAEKKGNEEEYLKKFLLELLQVAEYAEDHE